MGNLVDLLYSITNLLLVPVVAGLLLLLAWGLLEVGGFLRERWNRRRGLDPWRQLETALRQGTRSPREFFDLAPLPGFIGRFQKEGAEIMEQPVHSDKVADDLEIAAQGKLGRMSLGIRIGPMLGLMGTLIPMGPALLGLSKGDVDLMAQNLAVAFSTTVLGLLVGGIFYVISLSRRRWYAQDLVAVGFLCRIMGEEGNR